MMCKIAVFSPSCRTIGPLDTVTACALVLSHINASYPHRATITVLDQTYKYIHPADEFSDRQQTPDASKTGLILSNESVRSVYRYR